ncbi:class I glutamine amidotransferase-like protein [Lactifluus volemus]|nr:class I glutamine amidotransferase-like protein [Lactifluus volemus]
MPSALVLIADGTEEMEFTIVYDTLVRAGVNCTSVFITPSGSDKEEPGFARCSRGVRIVPDISQSQLSASSADKYDAIVIPGGAKGAETMSQSPFVQSLVKSFYDKENALVAKNFDYREDPVVISKGNLITSGLILLGTAFPFAFALVASLCGTEKRSEVINPMVFPSGTPLEDVVEI